MRDVYRVPHQMIDWSSDRSPGAEKPLPILILLPIYERYRVEDHGLRLPGEERIEVRARHNVLVPYDRPSSQWQFDRPEPDVWSVVIDLLLRRCAE